MLQIICKALGLVLLSGVLLAAQCSRKTQVNTNEKGGGDANAGAPNNDGANLGDSKSNNVTSNPSPSPNSNSSPSPTASPGSLSNPNSASPPSSNGTVPQGNQGNTGVEIKSEIGDNPDNEIEWDGISDKDGTGRLKIKNQ